MLFAIALLFAATDAGILAEEPARKTAPAPGTVAEPQAKISFSSVNVDGPYIAMTFDDGPHATNTPKLLEILAKRQIKATFFVVGECVDANPALLKREVAEGHEIGNHSWSHPDLGRSSEEKVRSQMQRTKEAIERAAGVECKVMRPPYGSLTANQRRWIHSEFGYKVILWDVDPLDWKEPGVSVVEHRIVSETKKGSIILSHDIHAPTIAAMPATLDALLAKGFKFVTVSELLAMAKPASAPAAVEIKKPAAENERPLVAPSPLPSAVPSASP